MIVRLRSLLDRRPAANQQEICACDQQCVCNVTSCNNGSSVHQANGATCIHDTPCLCSVQNRQHPLEQACCLASSTLLCQTSDSRIMHVQQPGPGFSAYLNKSRQKPQQLSQSGRTLAALSCGQSFCRSVWGQRCLSTARASGLAWSHLLAAVLAGQTTACQHSQVSASVLACQCFWYLLAAN